MSEPAPHIPRDRGQHRSLAVRNWHREALDGWAKAYDLDCGGEFAGKCAKCLLDLYVWEDSRNPSRSTRYTAATARSLGVPGFFIQFTITADDDLDAMDVTMVWPQITTIGGAEQFAEYLKVLRRCHDFIYHRPLEAIAPRLRSA